MKIKEQRLEYPTTNIFGHLNINSVRSKVDSYTEFIKNFNIFLISESKLDASFSKNQFKTNGYKCFRRDRNKYGGGLMFYISEGIPCKVLTNQAVSSDVEMMTIEFHQMKRKWLLMGVYKPPNQSDSEFAEEIITTFDHYVPSYENIILLGDLNITTENLHLNNLIQIFNLNALIKAPTCYQSHNPTCIDNILTNQKALFNLFKTSETGLSAHHKLISTIMKSGNFKGCSRKKVYRSYKYFDIDLFKIALQEELKHLENDAYSAFNSDFTNLLNGHAPLKTKILRYNNKTFITKELIKEIMKRSKLKNLFNENKNQENWCKYKTQRNDCVNLFCKTKKQYYKNLDVKEIAYNKKFWKSVWQRCLKFRKNHAVRK